MRCVKGRVFRNSNGGFTLFEMVVVICSIVILYMVAEERLNSLPAAAERANFYAIYEQIKTGVRFDMYSKLASGEISNLKMLEGSNPMNLLLEVPSNYFGELEEVTDTNIDRRNSWYFETSTGELVYVVGGASIDDVWVSFGNTEVNLGQIRLKLQNVYKETLDSSQILASSDIDESKGATWQALLLEPARPFRWNQQPEQPVEI